MADVASLPRRVCAVLPVKALKKEKVQRTLNDIERTIIELVNPAFNNHHAVFPRNQKQD